MDSGPSWLVAFMLGAVACLGGFFLGSTGAWNDAAALERQRRETAVAQCAERGLQAYRALDSGALICRPRARMEPQRLVL